MLRGMVAPSLCNLMQIFWNCKGFTLLMAYNRVPFKKGSSLNPITHSVPFLVTQMVLLNVLRLCL